MAGLEVRGLRKAFDDVEALRGVDLAVEPGELVSVLGPSGAGKTTLLRLIAGLERPTAGRVRLDGEDVTGREPQGRGVAIMFESYALYPHLTVSENAAFPLRAPGLRGKMRAEVIQERVAEVAKLLEIDPFLDRSPQALSGGQRQRVALSRALVRDAQAYLLDEPIAHLDAKLRHWLRGELKRRLKKVGAPILWTTPDGLEALAVGDRIAVLVEGELHQVGSPEEVYRRPATMAVARLVGDPAMNLALGRLVAREGGLAAHAWSADLPLAGELQRRFMEGGRSGEVWVGVRPADVALRAPGDGTLEGAVALVEPLGRFSILTVEVGGSALKVKHPGPAPVRVGERVSLLVDRERVHVFDVETGRAL